MAIIKRPINIIKNLQKNQAPNSIKNVEAAQPLANKNTESQPEIREEQLSIIIQEKLSSLIQKLDSAIPDIRQEMIIIHKELAKDPAQVTILSLPERAAIFKGYSKLTGIELVAIASKSKKSKAVSPDMFGI